MISVSYSKSFGWKRLYFTKGYGDCGYLIGFNSRWGGRCLWIRPSGCEPDR